MGRWDEKEKKLDTSIEDTTTEVFFDDIEERGEMEGVYIIQYDSETLGNCYSIQIPNCNIWMTEEMFRRVATGVENAMAKLRIQDKEKPKENSE